MKLNIAPSPPSILMYPNVFTERKKKPHTKGKNIVFFSYRQKTFDENSSKKPCILLLNFAIILHLFFIPMPSNYFFFCVVLWRLWCSAEWHCLQQIILSNLNEMLQHYFLNLSVPRVKAFADFFMDYWKGKSLWEWQVRSHSHRIIYKILMSIYMLYHFYRTGHQIRKWHF